MTPRGTGNPKSDRAAGPPVEGSGAPGAAVSASVADGSGVAGAAVPDPPADGSEVPDTAAPGSVPDGSGVPGAVVSDAIVDGAGVLGAVVSDPPTDGSGAPDTSASGPVGESGAPVAAERTSRRRVRTRERRDRTVVPRKPRRPPNRRAATPELPRPTVTERLVVVDRLLDGSIPAAGAVWSRATAWILRIALEQSVDELWARTEPDLARCPMRAQLLALRVLADPPVAARTAALWTALSHAAHHHDSELAPGVSELRRWREDTARIAGELAVLHR